MKLKHLVAMTALAIGSSAALAQDTGFYVGGKLGMSIMQSKDMRIDGHIPSVPGDYDYSVIGNKNKTVFNIGAKLGYDFYLNYSVPVRLELDYTHRAKAKIDSSLYDYSYINGTGGGVYDDNGARVDIKNSTLMTNLYYDFYNNTAFTPYVGLGLGVSFVKYQDDWDSISKNKFAWALMAGVSYELAPNLTAELEYRYLDSGKVKKSLSDGLWNDEFSAKLKSHDISIGIRYSF